MRLATISGLPPLLAALLLSACGGGGDGGNSDPPAGSGTPPAIYTVGGSVSGLRGTGLTLQLGGANNLVVAVDGTFVFSTRVVAGSNYVVTVLTQPVSPAQTCTVTSGTGNAQANVVSVLVACVTVPMTLTGTDPAPGAAAMSRATEPRLTFSVPLDVAALPSAQLSLTATGLAPVEIVSVVDAQELRLSPAAPLWPATEFQLSVSGLLGALGEGMDAPVALSFTTRDGEWQREPSDEFEEVDSAIFDTLRVAVGSDGRSVAAWSMTALGESGGRVRVNSFGPSGVEETFTTPHFLGVESLDVAIAANGTQYLVWSASLGGGLQRVLVSQRETGTGQWSAPVTLSRDVDLANLEPRIAAGENGGVYVVWKSGSSTPYRIVAAYRDGSTWSEPFTVNEGAQDVLAPAVIVDGTMRAHIVWQEAAGSQYEIKARQHLITAGHAAWLGSTANVMPGRNSSLFRLCGNVAGHAAVVSRDNSAAAGESLWAAVFDPASGWSPAASLEQAQSTSAFDAGIAIDAAGSVTAIWVGEYQGNEYQVLSRTLPAAVAGTTPQWSALRLHGEGIAPRVGFDERGHGMALWNSSSEEIQAARFTVDSDWSPAAILAAEPPGAMLGSPQFGFDGSGSATALWLELDFLNAFPNQGIGMRPGMARFE